MDVGEKPGTAPFMCGEKGHFVRQVTLDVNPIRCPMHPCSSLMLKIFEDGAGDEDMARQWLAQHSADFLVFDKSVKLATGVDLVSNLPA